MGLVGYPAVIENYTLPNPTVLGPGLYDHPSLAPDLFKDPRHRAYLLTCHWMLALFGRVYGDRCHLWHGGIDLAEWPDASQQAKSVDVLVYDKIRWNRPLREPELLLPLLAELRRRGLSFEVLRYGQYQHSAYRTALASSRSMLFLCEHETQGMAYQEALASNVPVLAWDNGYWLDPRRAVYEPEPVPASSVPYFSTECGLRFARAEEFRDRLTVFWRQLATFQPRGFVERELSLAASARRYLDGLSRDLRVELLGHRGSRRSRTVRTQVLGGAAEPTRQSFQAMKSGAQARSSSPLPPTPEMAQPAAEDVNGQAEIAQ